MRNRGLFLPLDVEVIDDHEEKVRAWQLTLLWNSLHGGFLSFYSEHFKFDLDPGSEPYIAFFKCYALTLAEFRKTRWHGSRALRYSRRIRMDVYDGLYDFFKEFNLVYEFSFDVRENSAVFHHHLLMLAMSCGVAVERMRSIKDGEFNFGPLHFNRLDSLALGGRVRAAKTINAKKFVLSEWQNHSDAYGGNKSEFARHYVRRLKNEMDVDVKEKTIRETWLTTPPAATK